MPKKIIRLAAQAAVALLLAGTSSASAADIYMGAPVDVATLPNGVQMNRSQLSGSLGVGARQTLAVAPNVWAFLGYSIVNVYVIQGRTGLIIYDTGATAAEGRTILAEIRKLSPLPIHTIIYSHKHYSAGAGVLAEGRPVVVIGNPSDAGPRAAEIVGGPYPELLPLQLTRGLEQMGHFLPKEGPDGSAGERIERPLPGRDADKAPDRLPITHAARDGEEMTIDGVKVQFFTANASDAPSLTAWLPDQKIVLNNFYWPVAANLYAPRGEVFRDAQSWIGGLKVIRDLKPEVMLSTHAAPVMGRDVIQRTLQHYIDFHAMILDQTLRGMLKGLGPEDLRHFVQAPAEFNDITENYGETLSWYPPSIYNYAFGWFSGDAADLNPVSPDFRSRELVRLLGGPAAVLKVAKAAEGRGQWAWALELTNHLVRAAPDNAQARRAKAALFRKHAELTPASIAHNFYMSQALALEGKIKLPTRAFDPAALARTPSCQLIDAFRVRLIPERSSGSAGLLAFKVADAQTCGLAVRPGVAEFLPDLGRAETPPLATLALSKADVVRLYRGDVGLQDLVRDQAIGVEGDRAAAARIAAAFETLAP